MEEKKVRNEQIDAHRQTELYSKDPSQKLAVQKTNQKEK